MNTMNTAVETMNIDAVVELVETIGEEMALEIGAEIIAADQVGALAAFCTFETVEKTTANLAEWLGEQWDANDYFIFMNEAAGEILDSLATRMSCRNGSTMFEIENGGYLVTEFITGGDDAPFIVCFNAGTTFPGYWDSLDMPVLVGLDIVESLRIPIGSKGMRVVL